MSWSFSTLIKGVESRLDAAMGVEDAKGTSAGSKETGESATAGSTNVGSGGGDADGGGGDVRGWTYSHIYYILGDEVLFFRTRHRLIGPIWEVVSAASR